MGKANDFNETESKGCYPKCLTKPLIFLIVIIILLFVCALLLCSSCSSCCKGVPAEVVTEVVTIEKPEPVVEEVIVEEPSVIEVDKIALIKEEFLSRGNIDDSFNLKDSVFFDKNSSFMTQKTSQNLDNTIKNKVKNARLVIVTGHACDLGNADYNKFLIEKRINRVVSAIRKRNPNVEIISSNDGQAKSQVRAKERRVDIYFYE